MEKTYRIEGMTCGGCVASVKQSLERVPGVTKANIQLEAPQGVLELERAIDEETLQAAIGKYTIEALPAELPTYVDSATELPEKSFTTYKPLFLIVSFIAGVSLLAQYPFEAFSGMLWMRHFMAGFFIVFAFFKLLNIRGFADSYQMYDIVAGAWKPWGFIYPFVELGLGISYLINFAPIWTNWITVVVLSVSSIGVIKSNLDKRKIKCACLGDVFNLPMSTVTIVEDVSMVAMAAGMLIYLI
jgi:copper chaperone CopZ